MKMYNKLHMRRMNQNIQDVPKGWEVELISGGDCARYKYTEISTAECIEGSAIASYYTSPGQHIRELLR